jgi:hypothetical protein
MLYQHQYTEVKQRWLKLPMWFFPLWLLRQQSGHKDRQLGLQLPVQHHHLWMLLVPGWLDACQV